MIAPPPLRSSTSCIASATSESTGSIRLAVAAGSEHRPQRWVLLRPEQDDLGQLGAERLERADEQALERVGDLTRACERAVGLVQELEPLVTLALGQVRAVCREQRQRRDREERERPGIRGRDHRAAQPEAGVAERHHEIHRQHVGDGAELHHALGEGDRAAIRITVTNPETCVAISAATQMRCPT